MKKIEVIVRTTEDNFPPQEKVILKFTEQTVPPAENNAVLSYPGLEIHLEHHRVFKDGQEVYMSRYEYGVLSLMAQHPGKLFIQRLPPIIRSQAAYAPPEVVDGKPPIYPYTPIKSSFEDAGSVEDMMLYTELEAAVHAMIQRLEYSFTFNPSLLTVQKRKQQVAEILKEAETYLWRIKEEMRCSTSTVEKTHSR